MGISSGHGASHSQLGGFGEHEGVSYAKGTIKRLITDGGFGFIKVEQGEDLFFHRNELQGVAYGSLREGQEVEFEVKQKEWSSQDNPGEACTA